MSRLSDWARACAHTHTPTPTPTSPPSATPSTLALSWVPEWTHPLSLLIREHFAHGHTLASWAQLSQARVSPGGHIQWMLVRLFLLSPCGSTWQSVLLAFSCLHLPSQLQMAARPPCSSFKGRPEGNILAWLCPRGRGRGEVSALGSCGAEGTEVRAVQAVFPHPGGGS